MIMKQLRVHLDKFRWIWVLFFLTGVVCSAGSAQEAPASAQEQTLEDMTPEQIAMATVRLTSPRNTLTTFLAAMNAIGGGKGEYWEAALACIYIEDRESEEQIATARVQALNLYAALQTITVDSELAEGIGDLGDYQPGDNSTVRLSEEPLIEVLFNWNDDGMWRISRRGLEDQEEELQVIAKEGEVVAEQAEEAEAVSISLGADARLVNPRRTMRTFLEAFRGDYYENGGREDAIATLDLSDVPPNIRVERGDEYASRLKNILDRDRVVVFESIDQAIDAKIQLILLDPLDTSGRRRIVLAPIPIEEGSETVEWKFSKESLAILEELWADYYINIQPVAGFQSEAPKVLSLQIRDWFSENTPYLMKELFLFENWKWLGLFLSIFLGMVVSRFVTFFLIRLVRRFFSKENLRLDKKLEREFIRPIRVGIMAWVWWLALKPLSLPDDILSKLKIAITTVSCMAFVWALYRLVDILGTYIAKKSQLTDNKYDDMIVPLIVRTLKLFVICVGTISVLEMNEFETVKILAGLGLFGMAIALAAKDTLGNIFGSLTVLMDRPFQIGDWVQIGGVDGSVESVGIRSTRIRTFYNSLVTVPNSTLTNAIVDNYGARRYRRYRTEIGITYDTPPDKIDAFCEGIRELIRQHPYTRKDYFHVYLNNFNTSSLDILLYVFHECPDWSTELRERHRLMNDIIRLANNMGVEFAFPTSTLYMQQVDASNGSSLNMNEADAMLEGRRQASQIVRDTLGENPPVPPPVAFDAPPGSIDEMTGDGDDGDE